MARRQVNVQQRTVATAGTTTQTINHPAPGRKVFLHAVTIRLTVNNPFARYRVNLVSPDGVSVIILGYGFINARRSDSVILTKPQRWYDKWNLQIAVTTNEDNTVIGYIYEWEESRP